MTRSLNASTLDDVLPREAWPDEARNFTPWQKDWLWSVAIKNTRFEREDMRKFPK